MDKASFRCFALSFLGGIWCAEQAPFVPGAIDETRRDAAGRLYPEAVSSLCLEGLSGQHAGTEAAEGIPLCKRGGR